MNPDLKEIKSIDPKVATDFPKFISTSITDQIKQADTKAFGTLGIIGIIISALLSRLSALKAAEGVISPLWLILFGISAVLILIALKASLKVVYPRLSKPTKKDMTYFGDISGLSKEEYVEWGRNANLNTIIYESYNNVHNISLVASKKYAALQKAMISTGIALIWTVFIILFS
jgi:hypothetical protein